jgi:hypothetical protein
VYTGATPLIGGSNVQSVNNSYTNVGVGVGGADLTVQQTEVIKFGSVGNRSEGDSFSRLTTLNDDVRFVLTATTVKSIVSGPVEIKSSRTTTVPVNITNRQTGTPYLVYPLSSTATGQTIVIDYTFIQPDNSITRMGKITVIVNGSNIPTIKEEFTYTGNNDGFVYFVPDTSSIYTGYNTLATVQNGAIVLKYRCDINFTGSLTYTYTVRQ